jgi:hypothetical protein
VAIKYKTFASIILTPILVVSTSFDYIWIGPVPLWLATLATGVFFSLIDSHFRLFLHQEIFKSWRWIVVPWISFIVVTVISDLLNGSMSVSLSKMVLLNLCTLGLLLSTRTYARVSERSSVLTIFALLGAAQGIVAVLQFLGIPSAWSFPEWLSEVFGKGVGEGIPGMSDTFEAVGRVRGTSLYVHKFNIFSGMVSTLLLVVALSGPRQLGARRLTYLSLVAMCIVSLIGTILTFSRSTILGCGVVLALCMACGIIRVRIRGLVSLIGLGAVLTIFLVYIGILESSQLPRIYDTDPLRETNMARLSSISIGWNAFLRSPVLGEGFLAGSPDLAVAIHSVPIRVLASYGVIGGLFYVLVIGSLLFGFLGRFRTAKGPQRVYSFCALSVVLVAFLDASTHSSGLLFYDVAQPAVIGALLGLTAEHTESGQPLVG